MLPKIKVPRCLQFSGEVECVSLHVFVDASQDAYRAVVYMRIVCYGRTLISLVASETRVPPLQSTSIHCLELMGALIGKRLALSVTKTLNIYKRSITF